MLITGPILAKPQADPLDAYLREKQSAAPMDLDAYLREKRVSDMAAKTGKAESLGRGAAQGATLGFGDEMSGSYSAAQKELERRPELKGVPDAELYALGGARNEDYTQARDQAREQNEAARRANPKTYLAGELGGGAVPAAAANIATGGAAALPMAVAQGAASGAGYSNANTLGGVAGDSALGGFLGAAGHEVGQALGGTLGRLANLAKSKSATAAGRAATQAGEESRAAVGVLKGQYGAEVQKGSRYVENLMRLEASMTPQQKALYASLHPEVENLQRQVTQSTLEALPDQAQTIAARKAAYEAGQSALPQTIAARTAELQQPQIGKDLSSLAKSYAEPVIAAAIAPPGMKEAAGLIFGRTRAGKAIATRVMRPGNQMAIWDAIQGASEAPLSGGDVGHFLRQAIQAAAAQQSTRQLVTQ